MFLTIGTSTAAVARAMLRHRDLLDFDIQEVGVSQTIIERARSTFLVADATKFERTAPVRIASLRDIQAFFTDGPVPPELAQRCAAWGTDIRFV